MADLRVSDADRQQVIDLLRTHTTDGRLTLEEFEERVGEALAAKTRADLRHVLRELPMPPEPRHAPPAPRRPRLVSVVPLLVVAIVALVLLLTHAIWWLIAIGFWMFRGGCGSRHHGHHRRRSPVEV